MKKTLLTMYLVVVLLISSCGAQPPAETSTPLPPTETSAPTATSAPTKPPTPTKKPTALAASPTAKTPIPTNLPNCTNSASFVADITIPDYSNVTASSTFTKTWRVKNTGTCIWGSDYTVSHYSEEPMGAPVSSPMSVTYPGETADISLNLIAPSSNGRHRGNFVIKDPDGKIMSIDSDSRLWLIINVTGATASASSPTSAVGGGTPVAAACAVTLDPVKVADAIKAINSYRAKNGLAPYAVNALLTNAAVAHANDMACNNFFTHTGTDGSTPATRVTTAGYSASSVTENVYGSYPPLSGQGVVSWFANDQGDPNHNLNLISSKYTEIGVAYSFFNNYGFYVIVFATPK